MAWLRSHICRGGEDFSPNWNRYTVPRTVFCREESLSWVRMNPGRRHFMPVMNGGQHACPVSLALLNKWMHPAGTKAGLEQKRCLILRKMAGLLHGSLEHQALRLGKT